MKKQGNYLYDQMNLAVYTKMAPFR